MLYHIMSKFSAIEDGYEPLSVVANVDGEDNRDQNTMVVMNAGPAT